MDFLKDFFSNFISEIAFAGIAILFSIGLLHFRRLFKIVREGKASLAPDKANTAYEYSGEIFISNRDGVSNLTNSRAIDYGVTWGPNSHWLSFQSASPKDNGLISIFVADVYTGKVINIMTCMLGEKFARPAQWDQQENLHIDLGGSVVVIKREELLKRLL